MPHLLAAISAHGYGHLAQTAPVLNALREKIPALQLTVRSGLSREVLARRIVGEFAHQHTADDFGMVMHSALEVDVAASAARYRELHEQWDANIERVARELEQAAPNLILADIPYLTLAAAQRAGIPAIAMCCLNWADIYGHYCHALSEAAQIHAQMLDAYSSAELFLRTEPAMPMPGLGNLRDIGPLAAVGAGRRAEIDQRFGLAKGERLVLVAMGGIAFRPPMEQWPRFPGVRFVVQRDWQVRRADVIVLEDLHMSFSDVLASCDVLITKPGYGAFAEAAAAGVPVLYVPRHDWPEERYLVEWLEGCLPVRSLAREMLAVGAFETLLADMLSLERPKRVPPTGVRQAAALIAERLS